MQLNRVYYIDYIRGGAVILVLLHHCGLFKETILAFHMPLFFFLSGWVFSFHNANPTFSVQLKKKFNRLLVPYFLFEILNLVIAFTLHHLFKYLHMENVYHVELPFAIRDIIFCLESKNYVGITSRFWFLPCMFVSDMFFWGIQKLIIRFHIELDRIIYLLLSILLVIFSYIETSILSFRLPFTLDSSLMATAFICLGYYLGPFFDKLYNLNVSLKLFCVIVSSIILALCIQGNDSFFLMFANSYGNYIYASLGAVAGIVLLCNSFFLVENILPKKQLLFLSTNSLIFYPIHLNIISFINKIFSYIDFTNVLESCKPLITIFVVLSLAIILINISNKYFKIFTGSIMLIK